MLSLQRAASLIVLCAAFVVTSSAGLSVAAYWEDPARTLTARAQAHFGALTDAEQRMLHAAPTRHLAWASKVEDPDHPLNDVTKAESWGKERTVRADLLAWLVSDPDASKLVHPSGVGLAAARILGRCKPSPTRWKCA